MPNMFESFFNPGDAWRSAQREAAGGWNEAKGYETPFWEQGLGQYGNLSGGINSLLHPEDLFNRFAGSYEESPATKQLIAQNRDQGMEAASAMGLGGSSAALGNIQQGAGNIANNARQQYIEQMMQNYLSGLGLSQNLYGLGANMGSRLGQQAQAQGNERAGLAYGQQAAPGELFGQIAGTGLDVFQPWIDKKLNVNRYNARPSAGGA